MSVDNQVIAPAVIGGMGGGIGSTLANTGNPAMIGFITAIAIIVVLGIVTRISQRG